MKITVTDTTRRTAPEYPCLKSSSSGRVVLFTAPETGFLLHPSSSEDNKIGYMSKAWAENEKFIPFTGQIVLGND